MSRQINLNDPDSWSDEDRVYLRDRVDTVPAEHRPLLVESVPASPVQTFDDVTGAALSISALTAFVQKWYPDEPGAPVEVVMRLLTDRDGLVDEEADDYDEWKAAELKGEMEKRGIEVPPKMTRADAIAALRANDAAKAPAEA